MATKMSKTARASTVGASKGASFATSVDVPALIATNNGKNAYVIVEGKTYQFKTPSPEFAHAVEQLSYQRVRADADRITKFYSDPNVFWVQLRAWMALCDLATKRNLNP